MMSCDNNIDELERLLQQLAWQDPEAFGALFNLQIVYDEQSGHPRGWVPTFESMGITGLHLDPQSFSGLIDERIQRMRQACR